jgi:hypothetical protein
MTNASRSSFLPGRTMYSPLSPVPCRALARKGNPPPPLRGEGVQERSPSPEGGGGEPSRATPTRPPGRGV